MDPDDQSEEVRRRMAALRSELEGDVQNVTDSARAVAEKARAMTDWRYVMRRFPFAAAGIALGVGYLVVPKRSQVIVPDAKTLAELAKLNQVWVKTGAPKASEKQGGMLGGLLALAASAATRYAMSWASQQVKSSMSAMATPTRPQETTEADEPLPQTSKYPPR